MNPISDKITKAIAMGEQLQSPPLVTKITIEFSFVWLGVLSPVLGPIIPVEIKNEHKELGWLYSEEKDTIVSWNEQVTHVDQQRFGIMLSDLKRVAEETLKSKQWSDTPEEGKLYREGNKILGYIPIDGKLHPYIFEL